MIEAFKQRPDLTALLDITWPEPPEDGSELYTLPNIHLSSHIAGSKNDEVHRMADYMIEEYKRFADGKPLMPPPVNPAPAPNEPPRNNRVVNIKATTQLQVVLVKPELFTDAKQIADHLMANKTVVLNLESATEANRRRIIDFLVGVAYAQNGNIKPVANQTYIVTPYNVGFVGDEFVGELENNGLIM